MFLKGRNCSTSSPSLSRRLLTSRNSSNSSSTSRGVGCRSSRWLVIRWVYSIRWCINSNSSSNNSSNSNSSSSNSSN